MHSTLPGRLPRLTPAWASLTPSVAIFLILGTLTTLWALASPLMTVPDEPSHAIKAAAVARGQFQAQSSGQQGSPVIVQVPAYFADLGTQTCTAFKVEVTADCAPDIDGNNRQLTAAPTTAGNYNPFYYLIVGLPSRLLAGAPAIYAMRIVSGLMSATFVTMAFLAARRMRYNQWPLVACAVTLTPMALYLAGSINPNSLEVVATAAFFLNLCLVFENFKSLEKVRAPLLAVGVSGFVLANTRALSLIWLGVAFIVALTIFGWKPLAAVVRDRVGMPVTILAVLGCATGLGWLIVADSFKSLIGSPSTITPDQALVTMLDRTFDYVSGYVGLMGWVDTMAPSGVQIFWHFSFAALLVAGLTARPARNRWALAPVVVSIIILPPILQSQVIHDLGYIWQGRYLLALVGLLFLSCGVALSARPFGSSAVAGNVSRWILGAAVATHFYAFIFALRRFTVGLLPLHTNWSEMGDASWQPPLTWQAISVTYFVALTAGALLLQRTLFPRTPGLARVTLAPTAARSRISPTEPLPGRHSCPLDRLGPDDQGMADAPRARTKLDSGRGSGNQVRYEGDRQNGT